MSGGQALFLLLILLTVSMCVSVLLSPESRRRRRERVEREAREKARVLRRKEKELNRSVKSGLWLTQPDGAVCVCVAEKGLGLGLDGDASRSRRRRRRRAAAKLALNSEADNCDIAAGRPRTRAAAGATRARIRRRIWRRIRIATTTPRRLGGGGDVFATVPNRVDSASGSGLTSSAAEREEETRPGRLSEEVALRIDSAKRTSSETNDVWFSIRAPFSRMRFHHGRSPNDDARRLVLGRNFHRSVSSPVVRRQFGSVRVRWGQGGHGVERRRRRRQRDIRALRGRADLRAPALLVRRVRVQRADQALAETEAGERDRAERVERAEWRRAPRTARRRRARESPPAAPRGGGQEPSYTTRLELNLELAEGGGREARGGTGATPRARRWTGKCDAASVGSLGESEGNRTRDSAFEAAVRSTQEVDPRRATVLSYVREELGEMSGRYEQLYEAAYGASRRVDENARRSLRF